MDLSFAFTGMMIWHFPTHSYLIMVLFSSANGKWDQARSHIYTQNVGNGNKRRSNLENMVEVIGRVVDLMKIAEMMWIATQWFVRFERQFIVVLTNGWKALSHGLYWLKPSYFRGHSKKDANYCSLSWEKCLIRKNKWHVDIFNAPSQPCRLFTLSRVVAVDLLLSMPWMTSTTLMHAWAEYLWAGSYGRHSAIFGYYFDALAS